MKQEQVTDEERQELYEAFIKQMREEGYAWFYIGRELAVVSHSLPTKE